MIEDVTPIEVPIELDYRAGDSIEVWLLWARSTNRVSVLVVDSRRDSTFELDVDPACALDAFRHPYAYAAARQFDCRSATGGRSATFAV